MFIDSFTRLHYSYKELNWSYFLRTSRRFSGSIAVAHLRAVLYEAEAMHAVLNEAAAMHAVLYEAEAVLALPNEPEAVRAVLYDAA